MTKRIFDELLAQQDEVEASIDVCIEAEWHWRRHNRWNFSTINVRIDGSINDTKEEQSETRVWMLETLPKLREVFDPRVEEAFARLSPP